MTNFIRDFLGTIKSCVLNDQLVTRMYPTGRYHYSGRKLSEANLTQKYPINGRYKDEEKNGWKCFG